MCMSDRRGKGNKSNEEDDDDDDDDDDNSSDEDDEKNFERGKQRNICMFWI